MTDLLTKTNLISNNTVISPTLQCCICLDLVFDPIECANCSKLFCADCINEWLKKSTECPNKHLFKKALTLDDWIKPSLEKIFLICPYSGCNYQYNYKNWKNHLKVCQCKSNGIETGTPTGEEVFKFKEIQFFVKDLNGRNHVFNLSTSTTIKEIKEKLKDKTGINVEDMRLSTGVKELQNEKMLEFYVFNNNSTFYQLTKLKGGINLFI